MTTQQQTSTLPHRLTPQRPRLWYTLVRQGHFQQLRAVPETTDTREVDMTTQQREAFENHMQRCREKSGCTIRDDEFDYQDFCAGYQAAQAQQVQGEAETRALLTRTAANLIAATHLLKDGGRKAAPSDQMFEQMLSDYKRVVSDVQDFLKGSPQPQPAQQVPERELLREIVNMWDGPLYRHEMLPIIAKARALLTQPTTKETTS